MESFGRNFAGLDPRTIADAHRAAARSRLRSERGEAGELAGEFSVKLSEATVRDFVVGMTVPVVGDVRAVDPAQVVLAVEIAVTTPSGGLNVKSREYAAAAIATCWVVDAAAEVVHAMGAPGPDGYAEQRKVRFDEPLAVPEAGRS